MALSVKSNRSATCLQPVFPDLFEKDLLPGNVAKEWVPVANIYENEINYKIELAAPGISEDDFAIKVNDGVLSISGETGQEEEITDLNYLRREYNYNSFNRKFTLPEDARVEGITAYYEDGILQLFVPKNGSINSEVREITVM